MKLVIWFLTTALFVLVCAIFYGACEAIFLSNLWWFWKGLLFFTAVDVYAIVVPAISKGYEII